MPVLLTVEIPDVLMAQLRVLADSRGCAPEVLLQRLATQAVIQSALTNPARRQATEAFRQRMQPLTRALQELHASAGKPALRKLAADATEGAGYNVSKSSVSNALNGQYPPSWKVLRPLVTALGGDVEQFRQLWTQAQTG